MGRYDLETVKSAATGMWPAILTNVGKIDDDYLTTKHGPCPKCGGVNRWRCFDDWRETGGAICNQCGDRMADGFAVISWSIGVGFLESLSLVAEFLGVSEQEPASKRKQPQNKPRSKASDLEWKDWNPMLAAVFCSRHGLDPASLKRSGAKFAQYKKKEIVIAIPGRTIDGGEPGWIIYQASGGKLRSGGSKGKKPELLKNKVIQA